MTVGISAFAASSRAIVCIADRALTYPGYAANAETDSGVAKIVDLPGDWCALFSCDSLTFPRRVLEKVIPHLEALDSVKALNVECIAKKAFEDCWWDEIEDQILKPILLTRADFAARPITVQPLDQKLVLKLAQEMSEYKQPCAMIFCGFDGDVPRMFVVNTPCQVDPYDWQGYATIGSGQETARNQMIWGQYEKDDSLESVIYQVFNAKVATEVLQGVGYAWDWRVLLPNRKPEPLPKTIDRDIDRLWETYNKMPFGKRGNAKDEAKRKTELLDRERRVREYASALLKRTK